MRVCARTDILVGVRIRSGLSTRLLAEMAGVNPSTINLIENGKRNPTPQTAKKIYTALGCGFDSIFYIEGEAGNKC